MPPKAKVEKADITAAALDVVRSKGAAALNARAVAAVLGTSTQPIFSHYKTMNELKLDVISAADAEYQAYLGRAMKAGKYPVYKASGMGYIRFAREERELFKLLFMRDRSEEVITEDHEQIRPILDIIKTNMGLSEQDAFRFHLEMWIYVHGIATMTATSYLEFDEEFISQVLTDAFAGLRERYQKGGDIHGGH